ncbi:uncharacterized protein ACDP82_014167 isoform 2-T2 [Pangshura tecta]
MVPGWDGVRLAPTLGGGKGRGGPCARRCPAAAGGRDGARGRAGGERGAGGRAALGASCLTARSLPSLRRERPRPSGTFKLEGAGPPPCPARTRGPAPGPAGTRPGRGLRGEAAGRRGLGPGAGGEARGPGCAATRLGGQPARAGPAGAGAGPAAQTRKREEAAWLPLDVNRAAGPGRAGLRGSRRGAAPTDPAQVMKFLKLFGRLKSVVIGMVHVGALPGTPQSSLPLTQITDKACHEAEIYKDAGVVLILSELKGLFFLMLLMKG